MCDLINNFWFRETMKAVEPSTSLSGEDTGYVHLSGVVALFIIVLPLSIVVWKLKTLEKHDHVVNDDDDDDICYIYYYNFDGDDLKRSFKNAKQKAKWLFWGGTKGMVYTSPSGKTIVVTNNPTGEPSKFFIGKYPAEEGTERLSKFYGWAICNGMMKYIKRYFLYQEELKCLIEYQSAKYNTCFRRYMKDSQGRKTIDLVKEVEQLNPDAPRFDALPDHERLGVLRSFDGYRWTCYTGDALHNLFKPSPQA
jgi:hypothetical protein